MRVLFAILLIALLPLRGWATDAMAVNMLGHAQNATKTIAIHAMFMGSDSHKHVKNAMTAHAGCQEHAQDGNASDPTPNLHGATGHTQHGSCTACQTCSATPVALQPGVPPLPLTLHSVPRYAGAAFASAEPARGFKPPIS